MHKCVYFHLESHTATYLAFYNSFRKMTNFTTLVMSIETNAFLIYYGLFSGADVLITYYTPLVLELIQPK